LSRPTPQVVQERICINPGVTYEVRVRPDSFFSERVTPSWLEINGWSDNGISGTIVFAYGEHLGRRRTTIAIVIYNQTNTFRKTITDNLKFDQFERRVIKPKDSYLPKSYPHPHKTYRQKKDPVVAVFSLLNYQLVHGDIDVDLIAGNTTDH
jgi:hypothetical protein